MPNPSSKPLRVLVSDDLGVMRLLVRNDLRSMGIENVVLATSGREALEMPHEVALRHHGHRLEHAADERPGAAQAHPGLQSVHIYNDGAVPEPIRATFSDKYVTNGIGTYSAKLMTETRGGRIVMRTSEEDAAGGPTNERTSD